MYGILLQHFFLCYSSGVQSIMRFLYGQCERLFVTELKNKHFTRQMFQKSFFSVAKSYVAVCFNYFLRMAIF